MFQKSLLVLALTCITLTAHAEKPVVLLFQEAKGISGNIRFLSEESLQFHSKPISNEIQNWLLQNKVALSENIENLNLRFVKSTQEFCALPDKDSKSVLLSIPTCNKKYKYDDEGGGLFILEALDKARIDLIRTSVQHLGISDRKQADDIAQAAYRAAKPQLGAVADPVPTTTVYTTKAAAWCSFGNGSGNVGPWFGRATSFVKEEAYNDSTSVAVAKCKESEAEKALCRCEVNYTSTTAVKK